MSDKLQGGVVAGSTSVSLPLELRKSADSTEQTGKVYTDVTGSYWRQGGVRVSITMATLGSVNAAYSSGGFVEVDGTNQPGVYRFDVPDAAFASGADWVVVTVKVASTFVQNFMFNLETIGAAGLSARIPTSLTGDGNIKADTLRVSGTAQTARDLGLALPAAAPQAAGGLITSAAGSLDLDEMNSDVEAIETRVTTALPNAAPQAAGGLITSTAGSLDLDEMNADVELIQAKTDNLPPDPADASDVAGAFSTVNATLTTIAGYLDTEIAAILADTNELQTDWANGGRLDLLIDAIKAVTDADGGANAVETGISKLQAIRALLAVSLGKATGGNTTTIPFKNPGDTATRVTLNDCDASGNRGNPTLNL